ASPAARSLRLYHRAARTRRPGPDQGLHALDVESIGVPADATPAVLGFTMFGHVLGRAVLVATAETPA
ncbi:YbhB/YbcL family Raf kinase inhibitor-like protein, partial [Amycolatopsis sp. NPDC000740]|uniref:YbhB/YbcL family Raf kinase inhibitor-like protein n=1 Tax=Amycolatopsis sp. NPDC000740 TaxID=3154269 RepID=UPI00332949E7